ncbi:MAG: type 1 glutamine amidotransferase [Deltaproteobacteria bacterium]|nr:type 1 glutamine amidotransferase [Deltaproteobacteria bacterium]
MSTALQFLIIDGYPRASRDEFDRAGMLHAWKLYANLLQRHLPGASSQVWFPSDHAAPPAGPADFHGIIWTGCNLTIYHLHEERVSRQIDYAREAYRAGTPQTGSCWGVQMAAVAAGGQVEANPRGREMGLARKIHLTPAGRGHPYTTGKPPVYNAFISHVDQVTRLPEGAALLASNDFTHVQAIAVRCGRGSFWATQYHPEYDLEAVARLIVAREPRLLREGFFEDSAALAGHVQKLEALAANPGRKDLRWQLDIDDDVLDADIREHEFASWIRELVLPSAAGGG